MHWMIRCQWLKKGAMCDGVEHVVHGMSGHCAVMSSHDSMGLVFKCLSKGTVDFLVKHIRKMSLKIFGSMCGGGVIAALAAGGKFGIFEGRSLALVHLIMMGVLFDYTLYAGYLGWQWRRVGTKQNEINELKKQEKPAVVTPEGTPDDIVNAKLEEVNGHLEIMRPLITNFGRRAKILSIQEGEYIVNYTGPESSGRESKHQPKRSLPRLRMSEFLGLLPSVMAAAIVCIVSKEIESDNALDYRTRLIDLLNICEVRSSLTDIRCL
ncbi:hypothetical protein Tco_1320402 [Tanacetum coccineum]